MEKIFLLTFNRAMAVWACFMDTLHAQNSRYRRIVKEAPPTGRPDDAEKQA